MNCDEDADSALTAKAEGAQDPEEKEDLPEDSSETVSLRSQEENVPAQESETTETAEPTEPT